VQGREAVAREVVAQGAGFRERKIVKFLSLEKEKLLILGIFI